MTPEQLQAASGEAAYWRDRDMALDHNHCFLCGVALDDGNRTDEHVFPKWLLRDLDLWNEELNLLNGGTIRYSRLKIPCCRECNSYWLSQVEDTVAQAFRAGPDAARGLDPTILCLWMAKLYYGIHFKELALPEDPRDRDGPTIVSPEHMARFAELHHVMQALRAKARFPRAPGSVRVFAAQVPDDAKHRFDYRDVLLVPFLAVRIGATVVLASLVDWGAMSEAVTSPTFEAAEQLELHPSQFAEVAAFGAYTALNFNREFAYLVEHKGDHDEIEPVIIEIAGGPEPTRPVFEPFVVEDYARVLSEFTGVEIERIYDAENRQLWTNLRKGDGSLALLTLEQAPVGTTVGPPDFAAPHSS